MWCQVFLKKKEANPPICAAPNSAFAVSWKLNLSTEASTLSVSRAFMTRLKLAREAGSSWGNDESAKISVDKFCALNSPLTARRAISTSKLTKISSPGKWFSTQNAHTMFVSSWGLKFSTFSAMSRPHKSKCKSPGCFFKTANAQSWLEMVCGTNAPLSRSCVCVPRPGSNPRIKKGVTSTIKSANSPAWAVSLIVVNAHSRLDKLCALGVFLESTR
mmetsp:Transcript_5158/g.17214  ORF Transcript_5158/g.17214 Transcript_5158/m.17214 type:complete len:217 (-) Transcript_5158:638-1288(-)